jgi:very-short-patch-repair endonuclease
MSYKVEFITRLFQKSSSKAIEHYCLTRLWHKLDNDEIKIVPQQYVNRHSDKYALTDVYLPQFNIHIEVNEPAHYSSEDRIQADEIRKIEIENNTGHTLYVIDCRKELKDIHQQIDHIVSEILKALETQQKNGTFKPWQPDTERNPEFWKLKNKISTTDDISLSNIEDICTLFDAEFSKTKRGYLRLGGLPHPKNASYLLWWPSEMTRKGWLNQMSADEEEIIETHADATIKLEHYEAHRNTSQKRVVFFHHKDILGLTSYKFKGIYAYDSQKSHPDVGTAWKRIRTSVHVNSPDVML